MRYIAILTLLILIAVPLHAAGDQPAKVSLDLSEVEVGQALTQLSQMSQVSILGDSTVKGKVSCHLSEVTVEQALTTVCGMNKLEWTKVYASPSGGEKASASKFFKLLDAIKALGGSAIVAADPNSNSQTVFVPNWKDPNADVDTVASNYSLKPIYLVRAVPEPVVAGTGTQAKGPQQGLTGAPPQDIQAATNQAWGYFSQMPPQQMWQVMDQLRHMMFSNMTDEQRQAMHDSFRQNRGQGGGPGNGPRTYGQDGSGGWGGHKNHNKDKTNGTS